MKNTARFVLCAFSIFISAIVVSQAFSQTVSPPDQITDLIAVPRNGEVHLTWTAPVNNGATITSYALARWETGSDVITTFPNLSTTTSTISTGLKNGVSYSFKIYAINSAGKSSDSNIASATPNPSLSLKDVPTQITNLQAKRDDGTVHLSWGKPNDNGSPITGYKISFWQVNSNIIHKKTLDSTVTSTSIKGLINEVPYAFKISAINAIGTGPDSNIESATPSAIVSVTVPNEVRGLNAIPSNSQVFLTWVEPSAKGAPITGYNVIVSEKGSSIFTTVPSFGDSTKATISGLKNGIAYEFKVAAINAAGTGKSSKLVTAVPTDNVPISITNLKATPGDGKVTLSWSVPASMLDSVSGYRVREYKAGEDSFVSHSIAGKATTVTITGLTNGAAYGFSVTGVNVEGIGPESNKVAVTPIGKSSAMSIPAWVKNNALWWAEGKISDMDYVQGIEYLINQGIIKIK